MNSTKVIPIIRTLSKSDRDDINLFPRQINSSGFTDEFNSSPVRRTFCLIVLVDVSICLIFWILYIQTKSNTGNSLQNYQKEICNYTFSTSLFDSVALAGGRFAYLEITYGCIKSKQPWFLAASTTLSSVFVIAKMIEFHPDVTSPQLNQLCAYLEIIITFVIIWTETMFLIYRVLPKEKSADRLLEYYRYLSEEYGSSQQSLTTCVLDRESLNSISDDEFFSPRQTRPGSPTNILHKEVLNLSKTLKETAATVCSNSKDWRYLAGDAVNGFITCKELASFTGKIFKIECFLHVSPQVLFKDLIYNVMDTPKWNPQVNTVEIIETISDSVDIIYNRSNPALKGYISPRDFVLLRVWGNIMNKNFIYMTSYNHPNRPPEPNVTRGNYAIGAILIEQHTMDQNQTKLIWIMNYDLKGNMFRSVVDRAMPKILQEMIGYLRQHCATLNDVC